MAADIQTVPRGQIGSWEDTFHSSLQYLRNGRVSVGLCEPCPSHACTRNVGMWDDLLTRSILYSILRLQQ